MVVYILQIKYIANYLSIRSVPSSLLFKNKMLLSKNVPGLKGFCFLGYSD